MPAPYTELSVTATPGRRHSFSAKADALPDPRFHDFVANVYEIHDMTANVLEIADMTANIYTVADFDVER